jgi:Protein of unknown function (DUF1765)
MLFDCFAVLLLLKISRPNPYPRKAHASDHQRLVLWRRRASDALSSSHHYNHDACFVLCDFMEEVLTIMSRYHQTHGETNVLDWAFWLQVCQQMMGSQNTLTEIRLLAFLYSTWNILISDENRRKELCLDWLLQPSFFERHFNHWCPMVRAYYLRLLCWRVARYDGDATDLDIAIYEALADYERRKRLRRSTKTLSKV